MNLEWSNNVFAIFLKKIHLFRELLFFDEKSHDKIINSILDDNIKYNHMII